MGGLRRTFAFVINVKTENFGKLAKFFSSILRLWPGFRGVVRFGLWDQLGIALLFGAICQLTLAVNFLWSDFLSNYSRASVGVGAVVCWIFLGAVANGRLKKYEKLRNFDANGEQFLEAQTHYLRGNWFETECCLKATLKKNPYDAEALLLLATLYRHVKRFSEARRTLFELEKLEAADFWYYEISLEKAAIQNDEREAKEEEREARAARLAAKKAEKSTQTTKSDAPEIAPEPQNPQTPEEPRVSLESVENDDAPQRPILKFCLNAAENASGDAA